MAGNEIIFSAVKTYNKVKDLEVDSDGYYKICIGAFNYFNSCNQIYVDEGVRDLIENKSSDLSRRLSKGFLVGEAGHPQYTSGMSRLDFYNRNARVDINNVSHHIKSIEMKPINKNVGVKGINNVVKVYGWIKPTGPKGPGVQQALDNKDQNVAFSIRCFTKDTEQGGVTIRKILQIVTWDWVLEPGIDIANTFDTSIATESRDIFRMDVNDIVVNNDISPVLKLGTEDKDIITRSNELVDSIKRNTTNLAILTNW